MGFLASKEEIKMDFKKYIQERKIIKEIEDIDFSLYNIEPAPKEGEKKCWKSQINEFTEEELNSVIKEVWLIIRPMDIQKIVNFVKMIPIVHLPYFISLKVQGNTGLATIPYHWGLVFQTNNNLFLSCQYPPVTIQKANDKKHAILQIMGRIKCKYYLEEENMKRIFNYLIINKRLTIRELKDIADNSHNKTYSALGNNCQLFCCNIIEKITGIDANSIRLNSNIFCYRYPKEEENLLFSKKIGNYITNNLSDYSHRFCLERNIYLWGSFFNAVLFVIIDIIIAEKKNGKSDEEIIKIINEYRYSVCDSVHRNILNDMISKLKCEIF